MSKLAYSIRSLDIQNFYPYYSLKSFIHRAMSSFIHFIQNKTISYFINLADKAQNDTLKFRDCIFPFLLGCVVFQFLFVFFNI